MIGSCFRPVPTRNAREAGTSPGVADNKGTMPRVRGRIKPKPLGGTEAEGPGGARDRARCVPLLRTASSPRHRAGPAVAFPHLLLLESMDHAARVIPLSQQRPPSEEAPRRGQGDRRGDPRIQVERGRQDGGGPRRRSRRHGQRLFRLQEEPGTGGGLLAVLWPGAEGTRCASSPDSRSDGRRASSRRSDEVTCPGTPRPWDPDRSGSRSSG